MRIWFLAAHAALLGVCIVMMVWAASGNIPEQGLQKELFQAAADAFKTALGATIGAMSAMIAAYIDYTREKAKLTFEIERLRAAPAPETTAAAAN